MHHSLRAKNCVLKNSVTDKGDVACSFDVEQTAELGINGQGMCSGFASHFEDGGWDF